MRFVMFTDNLSDLSVAVACASAKSAGVDGLDLTLRPSGHVRPENAETGLDAAKKSAGAAGMTIPMVSTALTDVDSPHAEAIFASAAHYGARASRLFQSRPGSFGLVNVAFTFQRHYFATAQPAVVDANPA